MFHRVFSQLAKSKFKIGLSVLGGVSLSAFAMVYAKETSSSALDPNNFKSFKLFEIYPITHNTNRYRFLLENESQRLGLNVASCLVVKAPIGDSGKDVIRPYTPVSDTEEKGFFDLIVKTYPDGVMSKHLRTLKPGDSLDFKGPFEKIHYTPNMKKKLGLIAGGTGITPMYQIIREILKNPNDNTDVTLVCANMTDEDMLLKNELDELQLRHKNFHVKYLVTGTEPAKFLNKDSLKKLLPPPSSDILVGVCGPPGFMKYLSGETKEDHSQGPLTGILKDIGYSESNVFKF